MRCTKAIFFLCLLLFVVFFIKTLIYKEVTATSVFEWSPRAKQNPDDVVLYLHIPKSAGFTFRRLLKYLMEDEIYPRKICAHYCMCAEGLKLVDLSADFSSTAKVQNCGLAFGHVDFTAVDIYEKYVKNINRDAGIVVVTSLRDPLARVLSEYFFIREYREDHPVTKQQISLEDYITIYCEEHNLNNLQTKILAGHALDGDHNIRDVDLLEIAKHNLISRVQVFGIVEDFALSSELIQFYFGRHLKEPILSSHINKKSKGGVSTLTGSIYKLIQEYNALDQKLYKFALAEFSQRVTVMKNSHLRQNNRA